MLLTITTTHKPATDMGYLLHKSPDNLHSKELSFGTAHVFYPEAGEERCTAALLLDIDPVGLVRKDRGQAFPLAQYVNDRPYVCSSFMSVAINRVFGTLISGKSKHRQELVDANIPLEAVIYSLPCPRGEVFLRDLFEPLGYEVAAEGSVLDEDFPEWGDSPYFTLKLRKTCKLRDLLIHLYVLIPVLDNKKHYFIGDDEVEKLLQYGEGWLSEHPQKEVIAHRYFKNMRSFSRRALEQLKEDAPEEDDGGEPAQSADEQEEALEETLSAASKEDDAGEDEGEGEKKVGLHRQRHDSVLRVLKGHDVSSVLDLGCGEGKLMRILKKEKSFSKVAGCDVSMRSLENALERLKPDRQRKGEPGLELFQSALTYKDKRFKDYDAAVLVEVIEHIDPPRLGAVERTVFDEARPRVVVVTTPNGEYNALFETLPAGEFRHADHRFEWSRAEFESWARPIAERHGYAVSFEPIGEVDEIYGAPSQMAVFVQVEQVEPSNG